MIMFITFIVLTLLAFKLGVYSTILAFVKFAAGALLFLSGGIILYVVWKRKRAREGSVKIA